MLYGGAVFGGKSDFLLGDFAQDVPGPYGKFWHGILFRKTYKQLEDLISRSKEIYPQWFGFSVSKAWNKTDKQWTWPNGATLRMRYMESDDDWLEYWGHAYTWMGWDELGTWASPVPYLRMKARLRCAQFPIPNLRIRASANPGGPGHQWVKQYFGIDRWPLGGMIFDAPDSSGMTRVYVKSRLNDNKIGIGNDPGYEARMEGVGSPEFVRALKDGDWNVVAGAYFPEFSIDRHIVKPIKLPAHWTRIRCGDWGSAKPFAFYWYAVSDGELPQFPRGALVFYRELYGMEKDQPNIGLKMNNDALGKLVTNQQELDEKINFSVLDPGCFQHHGGPSVAEQMGIDFTPADHERVAGWGQVRDRLVGEDGRPLIYFFDTCVHAIRTLPAIQHSSKRPEDVDTDAEDHAADAIRYGCMARPWIKAVPKKVAPRWPQQKSINEILAERRRKREN